MKQRIVLLIACAQLGFAAEQSPTNKIILTPARLAEFAEEARTNNAALWAARSRVTAAEENARSIPLWRDPEVMIGGMAAETMMREEDGDILYGVEQMLPVFGKEKAARNAARAVISVEESELEFRFQSLRKELAETLFQAALADELLAISQQDLLWLETLARNVEERYRVNDASQVDVLRVQNERARRQEQIRTDENNREAAYASVNRLLNRNVISAWPRLHLPEVAGPVFLTSKLLEFATRYEPKLLLLRQQRRSAEAMVQAARAEARPDLAAAVEARNYSRTGEGRSAAIELRMSLPWFNRGKYKAAIRREEARVQETDYQIEDYTYELRTDVHHLVANIDNARREALLYRDEIIPRSEQALRSAEAAWRSSRDAFRDVLDARRMLLEARTFYYKAVAAQYSWMADLILCCGIGDFEALEMLNQPMQTKEATE